MMKKKENEQLSIADTIFLGGSIITVDDANPEAEALAVKEGKIFAVGNCEDVLLYQGDGTQIIDLQGKTLMPGLIDAHTHLEMSAMIYDWMDISQINHPDYGYEKILEILREAAVVNKPGEWIKAFGYDPIINRELKALSADILDKVSCEHPIVVMIQSMHTIFVNHKALEVAGIIEDIQQPHDGDYERDEKGKLTGMLKESATIRLCFSIPPNTNPVNRGIIKRQIERYTQVGCTTIWDAGLSPVIPGGDLIMKELIQSSESPLRCMASYSPGARFPGRGQEGLGGNDRFNIVGVKFWYDGSPYTGNILLQEPYLDSELMQNGLGLPKNNCGERLFPIEKFEELVQKFHDEGCQIAVHTQGDRAIKEVIDTFGRVLTRSPRKDHRHRLEHCILFSPEDMKKAVELGLTASFHINHNYYYGEALRDEILGFERANRAMPVKSAIDAGLKISLHADSPMYPSLPFKLMRTAVTRKTRRGDPIGPGEGITINEAIKAITIDAAWQLFMETRLEA